MLQKIFSSELARGSTILFIMINFYNFLNYLFHFLTARLLGPADYGTLAVLMSIVYIFSIPTEAVQTVVSRYTSLLNVERDFGKMHFILSKIMLRGLKIALIGFIFFSLFAVLLSHFLRINYLLFFVAGIVLFGVILLPAVRGVIQGRKKFQWLGLNMIIESFSKVGIALLFISFGWKVYGALGGVLLGIFFSFVLSFLSIREITSAKKTEMRTEGIYVYSFSIFIVMLVVILMYSLDIVFAKLFFTDEVAGQYAVASMISKMIFFGTYPIGKAMFPLSAEQSDSGKKTRPLFRRSFILILVLCFIPLAVMWFYPGLLITLLFGEAYLEVAGILFYLGLALTLLSLTHLVLLYGIAVNR